MASLRWVKRHSLPVYIGSSHAGLQGSWLTKPAWCSGLGVSASLSAILAAFRLQSITNMVFRSQPAGIQVLTLPHATKRRWATDTSGTLAHLWWVLDC